MNLFTKQKQTHRLREFTVTSREGRQRGTDWELGIDVYTLLYLKQIANKDVLYSLRELCPIFCNNLNGKRI